ncbi:MAG: EI24 domain-containing protein [Burkholderiales bacterium]
MRDAAIALMRAAGNLFEPRLLAIVFLPMLGSIALWTALAWRFWNAWTASVAGVLTGTPVAGWLRRWGAAWVIDYTAMFAAAAALLPAVYVTALVITEIIAMPVIVKFVAARYYPHLAREAGGTLLGSVRNAMVGVAVFAVLWILTLPLWLTGAGAVLAPVLVSAYLTQRMFRYDALAEHASAAEFARITRDARGDLFLLGIMLSLLLYLPLVNLLVPVLSGLAFTHFCLGRLATERKRIIKTVN